MAEQDTKRNNWILTEDWLFAGVPIDGHVRLIVTNLETSTQVYDEPAHQAVRDLLAGRILRRDIEGRTLATECLKERNRVMGEGGK